MNCKFKFHLRAALHRGAAGPAGSAEMVGPADGPGGLLFPGFQIYGSRSKTEFIDFAGRRARTAPAGGLLFSDYLVHGSRSKTEFIGFAGRCARTVPAGGLLFPDFKVCGSRSKTEFFGFADRRARTKPAPGPPFLKFLARGSGCVQMKRDARKAPRPPCISSHYYISKRKELTMNALSRPFRRQSNTFFVPYSLF